MNEINVEYEVAKILNPTSIFDAVVNVPILGPQVFRPLATKQRLQKIRNYMNEHDIHDAASFEAAELDI